MTQTNSYVTQRRPWAFELALCFLGPFFFLSGALFFLSPLPGFYLYQGSANRLRGKMWAGISGFLGIVICLQMTGTYGAFGYLFIGVLPALLLGEALDRGLKPDLAVAVVAIFLVVLFYLALFGHATLSASTMEQFLKEQILQGIATVEKLQLENKGVLAKENLAYIKANPNEVIQILPGKLLAAMLILCAFPLLLLIRWNPKDMKNRLKIPRNYMRQWQSPEPLVFAAIFCFAFKIFEVPFMSIIADNLFDSLIIIYFLQGLSILAFFLDLFRSQGPFRMLIYGIAILFLNPMVASVGFMDLWLNFRTRYRIVKKNGE